MHQNEVFDGDVIFMRTAGQQKVKTKRTFIPRSEKMLDDLKKISGIDRSGMLATVTGFPEQIFESWEYRKGLSLPFGKKDIDNIIIAGLGGSAISGDIIQSLLLDEADVPIWVCREYGIPAWASERTLFIALSYSGNTEETLSAFVEAARRKCRIVGVSSGGKLRDFCKIAGATHVAIRPNLQPRAATAYLLFPTLGILDAAGIWSAEDAVIKAVDETSSIRGLIRMETPEAENPAKQIARRIYGRIPQIYGHGIYAPIARRWRGQFNENSKVVARDDVLPECNHNDIVGWSANPEKTRDFAVILLRDRDNEAPAMSVRLDYLFEMMTSVAGDVIEVDSAGEGKLARMMHLMYLGDFASNYLAVLRGVDPSPVDIIIGLKKKVGELGLVDRLQDELKNIC
ncbi:MAG: bifunctional phosphoglucose/phosphomannose isomerase [Thermoplasmata archaeon HGW-Thermoplasmata-1]|nr:MAG: bifunctional phosphoglucose/phosphomannose isomerase [Thermoplasmata archaeon HGW-Thermoplasmata-1]